MERLKRSVRPTDLLDRQIAVMESVSQSPLTKGNKVTLIYDSIGSSNTTAAFFQRLRDGGVQVVEFNQINPLKAHGKWGLIHRDHRKILVADGKVAIVGGVNISQVYSSGISRRKVDVKPTLPWRDTDVQIEGPGVAEFQRLFLDTWLKQKGPDLAAPSYFPKLKEDGNAQLHAKTAVIDGVWSTVGSTNMDYWSFVSNDEVNAVILSREIAVEMEKMFAKDLAESEEVQWNTWKRRPLADKIREWVAHLFLRWL